MITNYSTW